MYELHLGRYGTQVTGLLVRYSFEDIALDPYQRADECGCFFLSGGKARGDRLSFAVHQPEAPGVPDASFRPATQCAPSAQALPPECDDRLYDLTEVDGVLEGYTQCGDVRRPLRFQQVAGRPRRACRPPVAEDAQ